MNTNPFVKLSEIKIKQTRNWRLFKYLNVMKFNDLYEKCRPQPELYTNYVFHVAQY